MKSFEAMATAQLLVAAALVSSLLLMPSAEAARAIGVQKDLSSLLPGLPSCSPTLPPVVAPEYSPVPYTPDSPPYSSPSPVYQSPPAYSPSQVYQSPPSPVYQSAPSPVYQSPPSPVYASPPSSFSSPEFQFPPVTSPPAGGY